MEYSSGLPAGNELGGCWEIALLYDAIFAFTVEYTTVWRRNLMIL